MTADGLFELPPAQVCWYCGETSGPFETEHQIPRSRGGTDDTTVTSCRPCNSLKGALSLEEFRAGLAQRLDIAASSLVFFGEATPDRPMTTGIRRVMSLSAERTTVRISPAAARQLDLWLSFLRRTQPSATALDVVSQAILWSVRHELDELGFDEIPEPGIPMFDVTPRAPLTGRRELGQLARVQQLRAMVKVSADVWAWFQAAVRWRRSQGERVTYVSALDAVVLAHLRALAGRAGEGFPTQAVAVAAAYPAEGES